MFRYGLGATLLAVAAAAALCVGLARADGDPASDTLVFTNAFLPARASSKANADALRAQIAAAYSAGYRVKVAVVAARYDLGAIPSLFGKPTTYARFLGEELAGIYVGPLLIVMPNGYGIYDGGRSTAAETAVLGTLAKPASPRPDDLVTAAANAVSELLKRGALRSKDILAPYVETIRAAAVGTQLTALYYLSDDSGTAAAKLEILRGGTKLFTVEEPAHATGISRPERRTVVVPSSVSLAHTRLCVVATDPSGNVGRACRPIAVKR
jgi:hypothetical protein